MNLLVKLLIAVALLFVIVYLLSTLVGLLFWAALIGAIVVIVAGMIKLFSQDRRSRKSPNLSSHRRAERKADRALKDMERKVNRE